jgi:hypothetical protein
MGSLYEAQINFNRIGYKQVAPMGARRCRQKNVSFLVLPLQGTLSKKAKCKKAQSADTLTKKK